MLKKISFIAVLFFALSNQSMQVSDCISQAMFEKMQQEMPKKVAQEICNMALDQITQAATNPVCWCCCTAAIYAANYKINGIKKNR